jgi:RsiW-degrading membrane proteinase PrsW (M82 family)
MDVYISSQGSQKGPYSLEQIRQMQERHEILPNDYIWYQGLPAWIPIAQLQPEGSIGPPPLHQTASIKHGAAAAFDRVTGRITSIAGVEKIEGLHRKDFFSEIKKKRTDDDIEELFTTGTKATTPPLETISTQWPHPWLFIRAAIGAGLLYAGFFLGVARFHNLNFLPGLILVGSFGIPLATLIFFVEMNVPRNMSLYQIFKLVNAGGLAALIITMLLGEWVGYFGWRQTNTFGGATLTGVIEESAKIATVIIFMRNKLFTWTLNGLLIGAAVGTGFAAFESAGYALNALLGPIIDGIIQPVLDLVKHAAGMTEKEFTNNLVSTVVEQVQSGFATMRYVLRLRALLAPLGHIVWTGAAAAALWKVKGNQPFRWGMLADWRFLRVFLLVAACHSIWDMPLPDFSLFGYLPLWHLLLGFVAWIVALGYVQDGLKQLRQAQQAGSSPPSTAQPQVSPA